MRIFYAALFASVFASALISADYTTGVSSLYKDGEQKAIGRLLPTVEVKIIEQVGDKYRVEFEGYIEDGAPNAIYFVPNRRILVAGMSKNAEFEYKTLSTVKDEDKTFKKIRVQLLSDASEFSKDIESLFEKAAAMQVENCSICHVMHDKKEFSANQWPSMVNSMLSRTAISKQESYLLIQYLQKHAKDMPHTSFKEVK